MISWIAVALGQRLERDDDFAWSQFSSGWFLPYPWGRPISVSAAAPAEASEWITPGTCVDLKIPTPFFVPSKN